MEQTLDFSQAQLETQPAWKRRLWQGLLIICIMIASAGLIYIVNTPDEQFGWTLLQYGMYGLFILPATGWFYHKFSYYIRLKDDEVEIKQIQKRKESFSTDEVKHLSYRNNQLFVTLTNGEEKQFDFSGNRFKYTEIQEIKEQLHTFNQSKLN